MNKTTIALAAATAGFAALMVQTPAAEARGLGLRFGFGPSLFHSCRPPLYESGSGGTYRYSDDRYEDRESRQRTRTVKIPKATRTVEAPKQTKKVQKQQPVTPVALGLLADKSAPTMIAQGTSTLAQNDASLQPIGTKSISVTQSAPAPVTPVDCKQFVPSAGMTISVPCAQ